ncbi:MAG: 1,2-phenylacetyl-CoA epoxidase subunit PaaE [Flavobacteriales bacterium]|nr:1,2-phenylacetyl-CoA epoxidase subunit PaaE [Flavobacteriales bacterium]
MSRPKFHSLRIADIRKETADCVSVAFEVPQDLKEVYRFQQGQYLTLRQTIAGEDLRRSYSISSGINDNELRVAVKEVPGGAFSQFVNRELKVGDEMQVMTPTGNFTTTLDESANRSYLLIAAGSGITPIISIARSVLRKEPKSEVNLIYGNRLFNSIIFRDALEDLKDRYIGRFRVFHVLSGEPNEIPLFHGRIDSEKLAMFDRTFIPMAHMDAAFICGPEPLINASSNYLESLGMSKEKIHFELFLAPNQKAAAPVVKLKEIVQGDCFVSVILDGQQTDFRMPKDGIPILEAAQKQGLDIPFSCKGGMCCTCRAHLDAGEVSMDVNYALEPGEVEAGFILTCQSHPRSEKVVVNYDHQ